MNIRIADFYVEFTGMQYPYLEMFCKGYLTDQNAVDVSLTVTEEDIHAEQKRDSTVINRPMIETTVAYRKLAEWLPIRNAMVMHGTLIDADGAGVLFTALSGTGKTTHMMLWQKLLGDRMTVVNGDKPILRFLPDGVFGYGTPWNGKEKLGCNMRTSMKHICFIERSETNFVEPLAKSDAISRIMQQAYMPKDPASVAATFSLVDRLMDTCDLWIIHCNMDIEAAQVAYQTIFDNKGEN